jgi:hypothetical protein
MNHCRDAFLYHQLGLSSREVVLFPNRHTIFGILKICTEQGVLHYNAPIS